MEVIGVNIIVSHTGFSGTGTNFFGVINITNPSALTWISSNTATNPLPSVPVWVAQFNQRAFYFCNPTNAQPAILASNVLVPTTRNATVATYILTFGDNVPLLCGGTLGLSNQLGGVVQSLMVFKTQPTNIWQVAGDFAQAPPGGGAGSFDAQVSLTGQQLISINTLNIATGTNAPNSITQTPKGLAFLASDGWRIIGFDAHVSDPLGFAGTGITVPFTSSVQPTRVAAACNATTFRASTQNGSVGGSPQEEWCFDLVRGSWYGPHTFGVSLISTYGNSFIITPTPTLGFIWQSDLLPNAASVYTENSASYTCTYQSALMPDRIEVNELSTIKAVSYFGYGSGTNTFNFSFLDGNANVLVFASLTFITTQVLWGSFIWGSGQSLGAVANISGHDVPWPGPTTFDRMLVQISVTAAAGLRLGAFHIDYEDKGYTVTP
jgi:hypothetical protein